MAITRNGWKALGATAAVLGLLASVQVASAHGFGRLGRGDGERGELLAEALGITVEELQAARDKAFEKGLDQAVEAGEIEREDADLMLARQRLMRAVDHEAILAEALGVTTQELQAAREDGTGLRDLIAKQGLTAAELRTKLEAAHEAAVDQAVADGVITREQADALAETRGMRGMRGFGPGGHGMRGGHRGFGGMGGPLAPERGGAGIGEPDPAGLGGRLGAPQGGQDL